MLETDLKKDSVSYMSLNGLKDLDWDSKSGWLLTAQNLQRAAKVYELLATEHQTTLE